MNYLLLESNPVSNHSIRRRKPIVNGFVNDAPFNISKMVDGKRVYHEGYQSWVHMAHRCYGKVKEHYPTYSGAAVCDNWRSFMAFRAWWVGAYRDGWCLDKDILGDGKLYSPGTCIYIPQGLNKLLNTSPARRGAQPVGVTKFCGKYRAYVRNPVDDLHEFLGDFLTPELAHFAWRKRKNEIIDDMREYMDSVDRRIYPAVKLKIERIS